MRLPTRLADSARHRFAESLDQTEYAAIYDRVYGQRLSDWDLHLYAIYLYNGGIHEGIETGPNVSALQLSKLSALRERVNRIVKERFT